MTATPPTVFDLIEANHRQALDNIRNLLHQVGTQIDELAGAESDRPWQWVEGADVQAGSLVYVPGQGRWERCHRVEGVLHDDDDSEWIVLHFYVGPRNVMHWPVRPDAAVQVATEPVGDDGPVQQILRPLTTAKKETVQP